MNSSRTTRLATEVLVARPDPDRHPAGPHPRDPGLARGDLADHRERRAGRTEEPGGEGSAGGGLARQEQLIVLAASGRPFRGIPPEGAGRLEDGRRERQVLEDDRRVYRALAADVPQVRGEAIRAIHECVNGRLLAEPAPLRHPRPWPAMRPGKLLQGVGADGVSRAGNGLALERREAGRRAAET